MHTLDLIEVCKYSTAHSWMNRHYIRDGHCEWCGQRRITEWATARSGHWTRNRADWLELCIPCHKTFDGYKKSDRICVQCGASDWVPNPSPHAPGATRCRQCVNAANRQRARLRRLVRKAT